MQPQSDLLRAKLQKVVDAAIASGAAEMVDLQLPGPDPDTLTIAAQRGFAREFLDFFATVRIAGPTPCGHAMRLGQRVIVNDVATDPLFTDPAVRKMALAAGSRALVSAPILDRSGRLLGVVSTHYRQPQRLQKRELWLLDRLVASARKTIQAHAPVHRLSNDFELLGRVGCLGDISDAQRRRLLAAMFVRDCGPKETIVSGAHGPAAEVRILLSGLARLLAMDAKGRRTTLFLRSRGLLFGICELRPELERTVCWETMARSRVGVIGLRRLLSVLSAGKPDQIRAMLKELYGRAAGMFGRYAGFADFDLRRRAALALLELTEEIGVEKERGHLLRTAVPARIIGEMIGASRPKTSVALADLEHRGMILRAERRIVIATERLRAFVKARS